MGFSLLILVCTVTSWSKDDEKLNLEACVLKY